MILFWMANLKMDLTKGHILIYLLSPFSTFDLKVRNFDLGQVHSIEYSEGPYWW